MTADRRTPAPARSVRRGRATDRRARGMVTWWTHHAGSAALAAFGIVPEAYAATLWDHSH